MRIVYEQRDLMRQRRMVPIVPSTNETFLTNLLSLYQWARGK